MGSNEHIISAAGLSIGYSQKGTGNAVVVDNIEISAHRQELIAVLGRNGCGKSTLLRTLAGLQKPLKGTVLLQSKPLNHYHLSELARRVSFVSTEAIHVSNMSVFELVALGRAPYTGWMGRLTEEDRTFVADAISGVGINHLSNKNISELSDGERQRAMIARTLAQDTEVIILDEPTAFLDLPNRYEIVHLLKDLCVKKSKTILYSTHDLSIALSESDRIWLIAGNDMISGTPEDLVIQGKIAAAFDNDEICFDEKNGEFIKRDHAGISVHIQSSDIVLKTWTSRLFSRFGFIVSDQSVADICIEISRTGELISWLVISDNKLIFKEKTQISGTFADLARSITTR